MERKGQRERERKVGARVTERTKLSKQQQKKNEEKKANFFKVGTLVRVTLCKY